MTEPTNGTKPNGWRLSKDVPISIVAFIIVQTLAFTWFLSGQAATMSALVAAQSKQEMTRYSKEDASREREFQEQKFTLLGSKLDEGTRRIALLEGQVTELQNRSRAGK